MREGLGRLGGPPLIVQLIALLVGALIAAQLVTLLLTLVLPPAPPRVYKLGDIATALSTRALDDDRFDRVVQPGPPDLSARGWFVSADARAKLAATLHRPLGDVALGFYTQLPVGGMVNAVAPPRGLPKDAEPPPARHVNAAGPIPETNAAASNVEIAFSDDPGGVHPMTAALIQQMPGGPPGGGFPGGGPPGGGFPGGGLPGGGFPQSLPQPPSRAPQPRPPSPPPPSASAPAPAPPPASAPAAGRAPGDAAPIRDAARAAQPAPSLAPAPAPTTMPMPPSPIVRAPAFQSQPPSPRATVTAPRRPDRPASMPAQSAEEHREAAAVPDALAAASRAATNPASTAANASTAGRVVTAGRTPAPDRPLPIVRPAKGLFGLAPAPFVEGDFVAGVRLADGGWVVVSPRAEGFPSAWQRRVALWFLLSLLAVAPIAWLFARRIVGPLNDFAHAAEALGRDPGAAILPLDGPAEIGRAAHAFNQMQSRLRGFVDDRTAMIGAISHDLRTPLTRLRFRIEDVPDDQQDGLRDEVDEMEAMIASVIAFMHDASIPNARERRDLAEIVDDVVEGATVLGDVRAERMESAIVEVDPLGIRRVLDNLLTNAIKYGGGHARVALRVEADRAVADIVDSGPGVPEGELERIFEPFYRGEAARASDRQGSGLGLAVCRSIARAHGGDVALFRSPAGFTARVTLPLAFGDERRAA